LKKGETRQKMPKYNVETTVIYRFQVEAPNQLDAESLGTDFEEYNWELEIEKIEATPALEN
jgi:hypothetical protein